MDLARTSRLVQGHATELKEDMYHRLLSRVTGSYYARGPLARRLLHQETLLPQTGPLGLALVQGALGSRDQQGPKDLKELHLCPDQLTATIDSQEI